MCGCGAGMRHVHSVDIVHFDLKASNIFVTTMTSNGQLRAKVSGLWERYGWRTGKLDRLEVASILPTILWTFSQNRWT